MTLARVAAFGTWRKLGYRVRAGEKGLRIFGPVTRRLRVDEVASWLPGGGTRSTQLTSVELGGGATLKVHKSDVTTPYSRCVRESSYGSRSPRPSPCCERALPPGSKSEIKSAYLDL